MDTRAGREGGTNWESRIGIQTPLCAEQMAGGELLYNTGGSAQGGVVGKARRCKREGRYVCIYIHFIVEQKLTQHLVKQLYFNFKNKKYIYISSHRSLVHY